MPAIKALGPSEAGKPNAQQAAAINSIIEKINADLAVRYNGTQSFRAPLPQHADFLVRREVENAYKSEGWTSAKVEDPKNFLGKRNDAEPQVLVLTSVQAQAA